MKEYKSLWENLLSGHNNPKIVDWLISNNQWLIDSSVDFVESQPFDKQSNFKNDIAVLMESIELVFMLNDYEEIESVVDVSIFENSNFSNELVYYEKFLDGVFEKFSCGDNIEKDISAVSMKIDIIKSRIRKYNTF